MQSLALTVLIFCVSHGWNIVDCVYTKAIVSCKGKSVYIQFWKRCLQKTCQIDAKMSFLVCIRIFPSVVDLEIKI